MNKLPLPAAALLAPLLAASLSGCISFGAKPPKQLLTLEPAVTLPAGETQSSANAKTITIGVPAVPQELSTQRVPVRQAGTTLAYVKDALWVEPPARLFARLLSDTVTANTGRVVLSGRQSLMSPGARLGGELRSFGVDADSGEAVVIFDASLMRGTEAVFEKRRFEARVPVAPIDAASSADAISKAANQVAAQVAEWVGK